MICRILSRGGGVAAWNGTRGEHAWLPLGARSVARISGGIAGRPLVFDGAEFGFGLVQLSENGAAAELARRAAGEKLTRRGKNSETFCLARARVTPSGRRTPKNVRPIVARGLATGPRSHSPWSCPSSPA